MSASGTKIISNYLKLSISSHAWWSSALSAFSEGRIETTGYHGTNCLNPAPGLGFGMLNPADSFR